MKLKEGVRFVSTQVALSIAITAAAFLWYKEGFQFTITSGVEGTHGRSSKHYIEAAFDIRIRDLPDMDTARRLAKELAKNIGEMYDVVLERDHIHVEYDPKGGV